MITKTELQRLKKEANNIRIKTLETIGHLGVGHVGGSLSVIEVLTLLYFKEMNVDPREPKKIGRDLLVLSKGHAGPALYSTLALKGFFPLDWLKTLNKGGTLLPSHCDRNKTPGVDMTTGSLGQGLSAACGMALSCRIDNLDNYTYAIIGDGESDEGQNWEAAMFAAHYKLNKLIAFTDYNKLQLDGKTEDTMDLGDIEGKWRTFGWNVYRCDGHDIAAIESKVASAKLSSNKPNMIILDTIKGKGAAFAENKLTNHNMVVTDDIATEAINELKKEL